MIAGNKVAEASVEQLKAQIRIAEARVANMKRIAALPKDCNVREAIGTSKAADKGVVILQLDLALTKANDRTQRCYRLSERNRILREKI